MTWQADESCALSVSCGGQAIYTWTLELAPDGKSILQMAEGIPIPSGESMAKPAVSLTDR